MFTSLIENLGVKDVQFEELISLDADTIRSLRYVFCITHDRAVRRKRKGREQFLISISIVQSSIWRNLPLQVDRRPIQRRVRSPRRNLRPRSHRKRPLLRRADDPERMRHPGRPLRNLKPRLRLPRLFLRDRYRFRTP